MHCSEYAQFLSTCVVAVFWVYRSADGETSWRNIWLSKAPVIELRCPYKVQGLFSIKYIEVFMNTKCFHQ